MTTGPAPGLDQPDPAKDQSAHDALAKVGFRNQHRPKAVGWYGDGFDVGQRLFVDQIRTPGQLRELTHEIAALMDNDLLPPGA